ncbi:hypothetical protein GBA52_016321 [Prunus armeniaca]|nr:hypothetical protein GBA52_016321 [Prunus armeniaca]
MSWHSRPMIRNAVVRDELVRDADRLASRLADKVAKTFEFSLTGASSWSSPEDSDYATSTSQMKIQSSSQKHMESIGLTQQRNLPQYTNHCHGSSIMEAIAVIHSIPYTHTPQLQKILYHLNSCKIVMDIVKRLTHLAFLLSLKVLHI